MNIWFGPVRLLGRSYRPIASPFICSPDRKAIRQLMERDEPQRLIVAPLKRSVGRSAMRGRSPSRGRIGTPEARVAAGFPHEVWRMPA